MTQQKVKTPFDDAKLKLTAKPIETGARPPTFQLSTYLNNPQFTVYTNHDNGSGVTWISAGMDVGTFSMATEALLYLATDAPAGETIQIENKRDIPKEKRTDPKVTKQVVSKTLMGKDDDGKIWISIQDQNKPNAPKIRFYFLPNYYHSLSFKSGPNNALSSRLVVIGWVKQMRAMMYNLLMNNPNAKIDAENAKSKFMGNKGGNGGGGYNKSNNNGGGGYNKSNGGGASSGDGFGDGFDDDGGWD